jgi:hypothetical protein
MSLQRLKAGNILCNVEWYMGGQKYDFEKYSENFVDW